MEGVNYPGSGSTGREVQHLKEEYRRFTAKRYLFLIGCCILILALVGIATTLGSASLVGEVYAAIVAHFFPSLAETSSLATTIVWQYRLHRILFAIAAGFGLGIAGAVMQGCSETRSQSFHPWDLSGAAFGASLVIVFGIGGDLAIITAAFAFISRRIWHLQPLPLPGHIARA